MYIIRPKPGPVAKNATPRPTGGPTWLLIVAMWDHPLGALTAYKCIITIV